MLMMESRFWMVRFILLVDTMVQPKILLKDMIPLKIHGKHLASMSVARHGVASAVLNGKLYAIGGIGLSSVEIYDPSTESWSAGVALPSEVRYGTAITTNGMIYLIGGRNSSDQNINQVLCFDPSTNQWLQKQVCQKREWS